MRRRDATNHGLLLSLAAKRPGMLALAVSLALHAVLFGLARQRFPARSAPPPLIQVFLLTGAGGPLAGASGDGTKVAVAEAAARPVSVPDPAPVRAKHRRPSRVSPRRRRRAVAVSVASPDEGGTTGRASRTEASAPPAAAAGAVSRWAGAGGGARGGGGRRGRGGDGAGDQRASCVYCPAPRYPLIARARGWQGTVRVGLSVSADGSVTEASLRESSGYRVLDRAAVAVARRSRFAPPASRGMPSPLRGRIDYLFRLSNSLTGEGG